MRDTCFTLRLGGLGLGNPIKEQHTASQQVSAPLVDRIVHQDHHLGDCHEVQQSTKARLHSRKHTRQKEEAMYLQNHLPATLQHSMELSQEKGASAWLIPLPINGHGFTLNKSAFKDAFSLRYCWLLQNPPSHCTCSHQFSIEHALTCKTGGFPAIRHNEVCDITSSMFLEVCHGVTIKPHLQPLTGEVMSQNSAIADDGAHLDVTMYGFWGCRFELDVRVFNPLAQSNHRSLLASMYRQH